ncbi:hypothetical protein SBA2_260030 [Acidobacteriia bacterium SbA2]|nr:hypothetical protein SBA2_260030 [Acidobacteriia bacterium SbA2]
MCIDAIVGVQSLGNRIDRPGQQWLIVGVDPGQFQSSAQAVDGNVSIGQVVAFEELHHGRARELQVQRRNVREDNGDEIHLPQRCQRTWRYARCERSGGRILCEIALGLQLCRSFDTVKRKDFLREAIFGDLNFFRTQIRDKAMMLIAHYEIEQNFARGGANGRWTIRWTVWGRGLPGSEQTSDSRDQREKNSVT